MRLYKFKSFLRKVPLFRIYLSLVVGNKKLKIEI